MTALAAQAPAGAPAQAGVLKLLTFQVAGHSYAMSIAHIREICPNQELNRMPHMPKGVEGLLNLRGEVLPVINLRSRLGFPVEDLGTSKILVADLPTGRVGLRVDAVESVLDVPEDRITPPSPFLEGQEGAWIQGFIVLRERIISLLDPLHAGTMTAVRGAVILSEDVLDLERRLDEGLRNLISMAPAKDESGDHRIMPQMENAISYTEQEMAKVLERVEAMLTSTDVMFKHMGHLKHEVGMGHLKAPDADMAELDKLTTRLQDEVFALIQQIQFQDIARQKLERVMAHLRGMQGVLGSNLRATKKPD